MKKTPATEQACYDLGYANPATPSREYEWVHLVFVNAYTAGQADYQNQAPHNPAYDRDTFERIAQAVNHE